MEVPPEPATLLLAGDDEPFPRPREIVPQPDRVDRGSRLPSEVLEQPQFVAAEAGLAGRTPSTSRPTGSEPWTSGTSTVGPRCSPRSATTCSVPSTSTSASHERKPQRIGDRVDDRGERAVRFRGPLEHVAEPMHRAPRLVAVAIHQPVHGPLQHVAQRRAMSAAAPVASSSTPIPCSLPTSVPSAAATIA